jgi:hypothetical protein
VGRVGDPHVASPETTLPDGLTVNEDGPLALVAPHKVCEGVDRSTAIALAAENAEGVFGRGKGERVPNVQDERFWHTK